MDKKRNNTLIQYANEALLGPDSILNMSTMSIPESYNGQIAALGVSVAMSGILSTLAIYSKTSGKKKTETQKILDIIKVMINKDLSSESCPATVSRLQKCETSLFEYAVKLNDKQLLDILKKEVEDCSVALKQVVRTYNLV